MKSVNKIIAVVLFVLLAVPGFGLAKDMGGWEEDGVYNKLYQASELDKIKCKVIKLTKVKPMKGMSPGIAIIVDDGDGEEIMVHVGPKWFLGDSIGIKKGEKLKIRGSWAEIDGKDVFMASKIKKGDFFSLKVRLTKNGKPFWTMDKEELERERAAQ
mmetsp:Transcript_14750/g.7215  ORF Transcript_14750/g.7215 Transcript_14750/m.7215 type:complete len:157 (-) Transcript_14750:7-477(-)